MGSSLNEVRVAPSTFTEHLFDRSLARAVVRLEVFV